MGVSRASSADPPVVPPSIRGPAQETFRGPKIPEIDFDRSPFLVIWETTQACDLACLHCRAEARPLRDRYELRTHEAAELMTRVRSFGRPLFVLTGGDPAKRPDLLDLVKHGAGIGLRMGLTPSGTPLVDPPLIHALKDAGLSRLAVSLDGPDPSIHDGFRGVAGSYERTLDILAAARAAGLSTQVNSTITRWTLPHFDRMAELVRELGVSLWSVFFVVPMGRAQLRDSATGQELESVFHRMYDVARTAPFDVKSTAAPQYRRVILERQVRERREGERDHAPTPLTGGIGFSLADGLGRARGVNDGNGFLFISHRGEIHPSGFLPLSAGNVRSDDVVDVYRNHDLFRTLRDPQQLKGKCGVCEYRAVCGGSRARAWALTGDPLEAEPFCAHVPARYQRQVEAGEAQPVDAYFESRIPGWSRVGTFSPTRTARIPLPVFPSPPPGCP